MKVKNNRPEKGFTLIESLISLSLFLIIIISSLEFLITVKEHFFQLKEDQEIDISAFAALDKMRIDIQDSGRGLLIPQKLKVVTSLELDGNTLTIRSKEKDLALSSDLVSGSTQITLLSTSGVKKGQELSIHDRKKGETIVILAVDKKSVVLTSPINFSYPQLTTEVVLVKKISFYRDQKSQILRRKVNSSPAQPLLEGVDSIVFSYEETSNLAIVNLKMPEERTYEISVFPKNLDLASPEGTE
ncbi:PilW family protein [Acidobacteriota bacterium]